MITIDYAAHGARVAQRDALDRQVRAMRLRRAAESISLDMTLGQLAALKRGLVTEHEESIDADDELRRAPCCIVSLRLQGWGEVPTTGFGATPSEATAAAMHALAGMIEVRAEDALKRCARWLAEMERLQREAA